jgi:phosphohistidine phosphatase
MKLYLLRHATAVDLAASDAARALAPQGEEEARRVGLALAKLGAKPTLIGCSPLLRARQTAKIIAQTLAFTGRVEIFEELHNGTPTSLLLKAVKSRSRAQEVVLVGHMPSLAGHLSELVFDVPAARAGFTPAGAACIDLTQSQLSKSRLVWFKTHAELAKSVG